MIYSFDIFDTLILRKESPEITLSRLPESYRKARLELHESVYPITIKEFYGNIQESIVTELDLECEFLYANSEILKFIDSHPDDEFILISDMYLYSDHIEYILEELGVPKFYQKLYVSSECGVSKENFGKLFDYVTADIGSEFLHVGDHIKSDFIYPTMRQKKAIHYIKEFSQYSPNYNSFSDYYRGYADAILAPIMHISVEKIKALVKEKELDEIVCVGSVYDFYRDLLQPHFPDLVIKKLEISRYNIKFLSYGEIDQDKFIRQPHTESFLRHYYPETYADKVNENAPLLSKWAGFSEILTEEGDDLKEKSRQVKANFSKQLEKKSLSGENTLFVDFGYQGSFSGFVNDSPFFADKNNHLFLSVKEKSIHNPCFFGVEVMPFKMPMKGIRDPFWILDAEIIIKKGNSTPLAFTESHKNSESWDEMYDYLLATTRAYSAPAPLYQLERDIAHKVFKHICLIDDRYISMFNQLSQKLKYNKYSMSDYGDILSMKNGYCCIDVDKIIMFEEREYGSSQFLVLKDFKQDFGYDKTFPFFQYYRYLESISICDSWFKFAN